MLSSYETWPVQKYWHGDPCARAPMSRACMDYQSDVLKAEYGLGQAPGIVQAALPLVAIGFAVWALGKMARTNPRRGKKRRPSRGPRGRQLQRTRRSRQQARMLPRDRFGRFKRRRPIALGPA